MNLQPLLTLQEAAAYLRVSTRTVRRLVERGELEARYVGRSLRFEEATLEQFSSAPQRQTVGMLSFADSLRELEREFAA
jgi:excisionase family DNA binding protein